MAFSGGSSSSGNSSSSNQGDCSQAVSSQIQVGDAGRVTYTDGKSTRLRTEPMGSVIMSMPEGYAFTVIGGPRCSSGWRWWQVRTSNGQVGWAAEGEGSSYWIEPLPSSNQTGGNSGGSSSGGSDGQPQGEVVVKTISIQNSISSLYHPTISGISILKFKCFAQC